MTQRREVERAAAGARAQAGGSALVMPGGRHVPALDGVRGVAILLVLLAHFAFGEPATAVDWFISQVQAGGWIGVDLFFVLSGFLITGILLDTRDSPGRFRAFYARRVLRIFPLYYAALVVLLLVVPSLSPGMAAPMHYVVDHQAWYWLYLNNILSATSPPGAIPLVIMHFWSLALEEQFYLVWPTLVFLLSDRVLPIVCGVLFVASMGLSFMWWWLSPDGTGPLAALALYGRAGGLVLGALLAWLLRRPVASLVVKAAPAVAAVAALTVAMVAVVNHGLSWTPLMLSVGVLALQLGFAAFIVMALEAAPRASVGRALRSRFLTGCGKYSYAIYVVHPAVMVVVRRALLERYPEIFTRLGYLATQLVSACLAGALTALVALASWHLLEKHFLRLKERLAPRPSRRAAPLMRTEIVEA